MANHTPGPWVCYADTPSTDPNWHIITTANRLRLLANVHIEPGNAVDAANAALLTAAPDMLAVLRSLERSLCALSNSSRNTPFALKHMLEDCRAGIAKAEGRA